MTLLDAKRNMGLAHGGFLDPAERRRIIRQSSTAEEVAARVAALEEKIGRETILPGGQMFVCGRDLDEAICSVPGCGQFCDYLCDWPMGRGKTCDLALCGDHRHDVGEERDFCEIHFREFEKKTGLRRINPWPPKR